MPRSTYPIVGVHFKPFRVLPVIAAPYRPGPVSARRLLSSAVRVGAMKQTYAKTHVFKKDDLTQVLHSENDESSFTKTKVCVTMGPALNNTELLCQVLEAGATCARVDLTWQVLKNHRRSLRLLQDAMLETRRLCAVMLDTLGRDILVRRPFAQDEHGWPIYMESMKVEAGQKVLITTDPEVECTPQVFPITYPKLPSMVHPGDYIFMGRYLATGADDCSLYIKVERVSETEIECVAKSSAVLDGLLTLYHIERSDEGLSNLQNDMPALSDWDKEAITTLTSEYEIDFLTLSYCRSPEDVLEARAFLDSIGQHGMKILAKCETRQSLLNFRSICDVADGIVISRGNLGLDVAAEKVALVQKGVISYCLGQAKPTMITRVVDTMAKSPRPTRAEATDIANAVLDGVDAIMLGAETYRGKYPLDTVRTVAAICREAEGVFDRDSHFEHLAMHDHEMFHVNSYADMEGGDDESDDFRGGAYLPRRRGASMARSRSSGSFFSDANANGVANGGSILGLKSPKSRPRAAISMAFKLESIAYGAVRAADKVGASLIVCFSHSGHTASLIAKYRPAMPIMTLVVPYLKKTDDMKWKLEGRSTARQSLLTSGLLPVMAAPTPSAGESLLEESIALAAGNGLLKPNDFVVSVSLSATHEVMIKVVSVSESGTGIKRVRHNSLLHLVKKPTAKQAGLDGIAEESVDTPSVYDSFYQGTPSTDGAAAALRRLTRGSVLVGKGSDALVAYEHLPDYEASNGHL